MTLSVFIPQHKYKLALGLFVAYLCLAFYKIGVNGLWYDECFSIYLGKASIDEILHYSLYEDTNPPLYLIIMHYWNHLFGESEAALRSVSAIASSLACSIFFLFALRFFNWQTALFTVLLYITSNELYYYSQEGRTYGLVLLFTVLSNFAFMSLIEKPSWYTALLVGIFNITVFYLHTLGCINMFGQGLLALILGFKLELFKQKNKSFLGYPLKFITYFLASYLVFVVLFWPWHERFFGIITQGTKGFWLQKPTFVEYKQVLYDFYNADYLFYVAFGSILLLSVLLLVFKKLREDSFNIKYLLIPLIIGPILFHVDFFAASITPIFLKRYILFTLLGFVLLFAYLVSSIKFNFKIKCLIIVVFCIASAFKMNVPRPCNWDYKKGVKYLKKKINPKTLITTDNPMVMAYYLDRKGAFNLYNAARDQALDKKGIYVSTTTDWPDTKDLSMYTDIYFTRSFDDYADPERKVENRLKEKFIWKEDVYFDGLFISRFINPVPDSITMSEIKAKILSSSDWMKQIQEKATKGGISIDSMLTIDALWDYKTDLQSKQ